MSAQTFSATIAGVTKAIERPRCSFVVNGIGDCSFDVISTGAAYVPSDGDAVVITLGGAAFWTGNVIEAQAQFLGPTAGTRVTVTAQDKNHLLTRALHNTIYAAGSLESTIDILTGVGGNWTDVGITKDAGQATGPTLDVVTAAWMKGHELAKYLSALSGYIHCVDAASAIKFWSPGSVSSGVTLSTANSNIEVVSWQHDRWDYRNRVWVVYGPSEVRTVSDPFNGDGSTRDFSLHYRVASAPGTITLTDGATTVVAPVGVYGVDTSMEWTFDAATGSYGAIRQKNTFTVLSSSWLLTASYASQFPNYVFVDDAAEVAARGQWNDALALPDVTDLDEATASGAAFIRTSIPRPKTCRIVTRTDGITAGSTVVVSLSEIGISETMLVQRIDVTFDKSGSNADPLYTLDLVSGSELADTSAALFQRIVGGGGSSLASGSSAGSGSVTTTVITLVEGDLGGSRLNGSVHTTWTPTREHREWRCPASGDFTAHAEVWTDDAGTSVTPRVYDITAAAAVATGTSSTSTTAVKQQLTFTATAGHDYRLELLPGNTTNAVYGLGKVRV
ncbi:MAG: hypothetical protein IPO08_21550 [Xanthomonadales bacterium]|nr:hypothetical protein [Xanthomonadales bacterium]